MNPCSPLPTPGGDRGKWEWPEHSQVYPPDRMKSPFGQEFPPPRAAVGRAALGSCLVSSLSPADRALTLYGDMEALETPAVGSNPSIPLTSGQIRPITPLSKPSTLLTYKRTSHIQPTACWQGGRRGWRGYRTAEPNHCNGHPHQNRSRRVRGGGTQFPRLHG